jgi:RNA polymerase sigma-70 factor (ECF subfamily)
MSPLPDPRGARPVNIDDAEADAIAINRVLSGDTQAFAQIVSRYQAPLYRYAVSIVLDHEAAADMVQDAFVRAYTHLADCRDRLRFHAWIFQTLRHRCLDYLKAPRRRDVSLEAAAWVADSGEGPGARVERLRLRGDIMRALAELPPAQREAFLMHYVEGMSYERMAELLSASVSALKMRVARAREALGDALRSGQVTDAPFGRLSNRP